MGRLTNCSDAFKNSISHRDLHPAQPHTTQKNEIGKLGLFYLVYLVGFNPEGLNLAQKGCMESRVCAPATICSKSENENATNIALFWHFKSENN